MQDRLICVSMLKGIFPLERTMFVSWVMSPMGHKAVREPIWMVEAISVP
jgi:hypothetical protein